MIGVAWFVYLAGGLWRAIIINQLANTPDAVAELMGGEVRYTWSGVRVVATEARVVWKGGLRGPVTICSKSDRSKTRLSGLAQSDEIRRILK